HLHLHLNRFAPGCGWNEHGESTCHQCSGDIRAVSHDNSRPLAPTRILDRNAKGIARCPPIISVVNSHLCVLGVAGEIMVVRRVVRAVSLLSLADTECSKHLGSDLAQLSVILARPDEKHCCIHVPSNSSLSPPSARGATMVTERVCRRWMRRVVRVENTPWL